MASYVALKVLKVNWMRGATAVDCFATRIIERSWWILVKEDASLREDVDCWCHADTVNVGTF